MNPHQITWLAHYGEELLPQYNADGSENLYQDIDRTRLTAFSLVRGNGILVRIHFDDGKRLIYRRRVEVRPGDKVTICHLAGWQQTVNGENVQSIACIFEENGTVEIINEWKEGWYDKPEFLDFE
jgi:hypothetical protein